MAEKGFVTFGIDSMRLFALQSPKLAGYEIDVDVLATLSIDACYRVRELVRNSAQFMKHAHRSRMTCADINKALKWSNTPPVLGHGINCEDREFYKESADDRYFVAEDQEVDLALYAQHIIQSNNSLELKLNPKGLKVDWMDGTPSKAVKRATTEPD